MLNRVVLIGRLTADPELRYIPSSGTPLTNFTLAVDRPFTNQQGERETDFINITVWRKQAENCANYLNKGSMAAVEGRLQIRKYDDKEGIRRIAVDVVADNVRFLESRKSKEGNADYSFDTANQGGNDENVNEDDIPF